MPMPFGWGFVSRGKFKMKISACRGRSDGTMRAKLAQTLLETKKDNLSQFRYWS